MLDYSLIVALLAVEREGSFRGAARYLDISPSAVSQQIKLLEERIGAIAVDRDTPIRPTQIGYSLCRHAEQVMALEDKMKSSNSLKFIGDGSSPISVKIVVDADSLATWFLDVMEAEMQRNANWLFDIRCRNHDETQADLLSGKALVAVSNQRKPPQGFSSVYLGIHRYRAVAGPEFMSRYFSDGVTQDSLTKAPTLSGGYDDLQFQWLFEIFKKEISTPTHRIPNSMSFVAATKKNIGWSVNPSELVQEDLDNDQLIELLPNRTLDKKFYWHYCRAISDSVKPITETITRIARKNLVQEEPQIYKVRLAKSTKENKQLGPPN